MHVKFRTNFILFTIQSINLFFMHNFRLQKFKFKHVIDDIVIDFLCLKNFASMKDVRRKYNPMIDSSKFTYNEEILWSCRQTLSLFFTSK